MYPKYFAIEDGQGNYPWSVYYQLSATQGRKQLNVGCAEKEAQVLVAELESLNQEAA